MGLLPSIAARFSRWRSFFSTSGIDPRHQLGAEGEKIAARFLRQEGFKVLYRGFHPEGGGEIDLVCREGETLVFVEVKTRKGTAFGQPGDGLRPDQQKRIIRSAFTWLRMLGSPEVDFRFDLVEIVFLAGKPMPRLTRNAFTLPETMRYQSRA